MGVVLFIMAFGCRPFDRQLPITAGSEPLQIIEKLERKRVSGNLSDLFAISLQADPKQRLSVYRLRR